MISSIRSFGRLFLSVVVKSQEGFFLCPVSFCASWSNAQLRSSCRGLSNLPLPERVVFQATRHGPGSAWIVELIGMKSPGLGRPNPQNPRVYCVLTMLTGWHEKGAMKKPMVQRCDTAECHWAMCLDIKDIPPVLCFKASGWSFTASPKPMGFRDLLVGLVCLVTGLIRMLRIIPKWPPEFQLFSGEWILIIQPGFWFFDHSIFVHSCSFLFSYPVYKHSMIIIIFIHFPHCIPSYPGCNFSQVRSAWLQIMAAAETAPKIGSKAPKNFG